MSISKLERLWATAKSWKEISRQRYELRTLSDDLLKDIGISRADALQEADRHFWDSAMVCDSSLKKCRDWDSGTSRDRAKIAAVFNTK